jgi:flagellar export protein FliJ
MAFRFSLEAVLRYRRSLEDGEKMRLQALLARRAALQAELERVRHAYLQLQTALNQELQRAPVPAIEIQFSVAGLRSSQRREAGLQSQMQQLQAEITQQTARYRQEQRKREMLESLREAQLSDYRLNQQRRQQALLDELFLLRRGRGQA